MAPGSEKKGDFPGEGSQERQERQEHPEHQKRQERRTPQSQRKRSWRLFWRRRISFSGYFGTTVVCLLAAVVLYLTPLSRSLSGKTAGLLLGGLAFVSLVHIGIGLPGVLRRSETSAGWIALLLVHGLIVLVYLLLLLLRLNFAP